MGLLYFVIGVIVGTLPLIALVERPRAAPAAINRSAFEQRGVMQGRVLAPHRIVERVQMARVLVFVGHFDAIHFRLIHDFDFECAQFRENFIQLFRRRHAVRQHLVDVIVSQMPLLAREADQLLDFFRQLVLRHGNCAGGGIGVAASDVQLGSAGSTGSQTATAATAAVNAGELLALFP